MHIKEGPNEATSEHALADNENVNLRSIAFNGHPPTRVKCLESRIALGNADGDNSISEPRASLHLLNVTGFGYAILRAGTVELRQSAACRFLPKKDIRTHFE